MIDDFDFPCSDTFRAYAQGEYYCPLKEQIIIPTPNERTWRLYAAWQPKPMKPRRILPVLPRNPIEDELTRRDYV